MMLGHSVLSRPTVSSSTSRTVLDSTVLLLVMGMAYPDGELIDFRGPRYELTPTFCTAWYDYQNLFPTTSIQQSNHQPVLGFLIMPAWHSVIQHWWNLQFSGCSQDWLMKWHRFEIIDLRDGEVLNVLSALSLTQQKIYDFCWHIDFPPLGWIYGHHGAHT